MAKLSKKKRLVRGFSVAIKAGGYLVHHIVRNYIPLLKAQLIDIFKSRSFAKGILNDFWQWQVMDCFMAYFIAKENQR